MNKVYLFGTGDYAKERLGAILASDRIGCKPGFIDDMKSTIRREVDRYIDVSESDIDIQVRERMLIAYIPLVKSASSFRNRTDCAHITTEQGTDNYEPIEEEGHAELKTVQS